MRNEDILRASSLPAPDSCGLCLPRGSGAPSARSAAATAARPAFGAHLCHNSRAQEDAFSVYIDITRSCARGGAAEGSGLGGGSGGVSALAQPGASCGAAGAADNAPEDDLSWFGEPTPPPPPITPALSRSPGAGTDAHTRPLAAAPPPSLSIFTPRQHARPPAPASPQHDPTRPARPLPCAPAQPCLTATAARRLRNSPPPTSTATSWQP
jgi:hypothetical protein